MLGQHFPYTYCTFAQPCEELDWGTKPDQNQPASILPSLGRFPLLREEGSGNTQWMSLGFFQQVLAYVVLNTSVTATQENKSTKYILLSLELLTLLWETEVGMWYLEFTGFVQSFTSDNSGRFITVLLLL